MSAQAWPYGKRWPSDVSEFGKHGTFNTDELVCSLEVALPGNPERWALSFYNRLVSPGRHFLVGVLHTTWEGRGFDGADNAYSEIMATAVEVEDQYWGNMWLVDRALSARFAYFAPQRVLSEGQLTTENVGTIFSAIRERVLMRHPNLNFRRAGPFLVDPVMPEVFLAPCPEGRHSSPIVGTQPPQPCPFCALPKYDDPLIAQPAPIDTPPTLGDRILAGFALRFEWEVRDKENTDFQRQYTELREALLANGYFETDRLDDIPNVYRGHDLTWPLYRCDFYAPFRAADGFWWSQPDQYILRDETLADAPLQPQAARAVPERHLLPNWLRRTGGVARKTDA